MTDHEQLISFLTKYTVNYIDPQTSIITELVTRGSNYGGAEDDEDGDGGRQRQGEKMPACYLVKDMIVEEDGDGVVLGNVLETLAMHQQLSNKYILTLIHHQVFIKTITTSQSTQKPSQSQQCSFSQLSHPHLHPNHPNHPNKSTNNITKLHPQSPSPYSLSQSHQSHHSHQSSHQSHQQTLLTQNKTAIRAIYQYGKLTLKEEIGNRIASATQFQEEELWAILAAIVQALGYLEEEGIVYGVLGGERIFINDSLVKVLDPSATATDPLLITQGRLYSPQILNESQNLNMFKSDVYITGLILLQCGLLLDLTTPPSYPHSNSPSPNPVPHLQTFTKTYSTHLSQILQMCLQQNPEQRPSFEDLKKYLAKELDMNDFQGAYDRMGVRLVRAMEGDLEDGGNGVVVEIQGEYQECACDVLYESVGHDQLQSNRKKNLTEYQLAKLKYLSIHTPPKKSSRQSRQSLLSDPDSNPNPNPNRNSNPPHPSLNHNHNHNPQSHNQRIYSQQHYQPQQRSSSPIQTRRNSRNLYGGGYDFNMAISESVYTDQIMPITNGNKYMDKTNRKLQKIDKNTQYYPPQPHQPHQSHQSQKQNIPQPQPQTLPNTNQKIKKTKLIKQKLVRNCQQQNVDQTFGAVKMKRNNHGDLRNSTNGGNGSGNGNGIGKGEKGDGMREMGMGDRFGNCGGRGESIQEELDQESESSYLYYNTTGSSKVSKKQNNADSQISQKSQTNPISKSGSRYQNSQHSQYHPQTSQSTQSTQKMTTLKSVKSRPELSGQQTYTDPKLMQAIREDLVRISTTKNINMNMNTSERQENRWFK